MADRGRAPAPAGDRHHRRHVPVGGSEGNRGIEFRFHLVEVVRIRQPERQLLGALIEAYPGVLTRTSQTNPQYH